MMSTNVAGMQQQQRSRGNSIECWDDDSDFEDIDDIPTHYSPISAAPTAAASVIGSPTFSRTSDFHNRRESLCSSRMSMASAYDLDGPEVGEHEVPLDESPAAAIASAIRAGIPIPENVPSSALVGGTIKRLGNNKKSRKIAAHDDWGEDLELPTVVNNLSVKRTEFPDALDEIIDGRRSGHISPMRMDFMSTASSQLNRFRDSPDDDDFMKDFDDLPPLKMSSRLVNRSSLPSPPSSEAPRDLRSMDDDFDADFEFPADAPLRLNLKPIDGNRGLSTLDSGFDDWGELDSGIGGSYCGGSRRGDSTNGDRMNSASGLLSPTMTAMTMESEDDMPLDGLILPDGELPDLNTVLENRKRQVVSPTREDPPFEVQKDSDAEQDDGFFDGIEIGDGELFDARKLTLNRNVKQKQEPRKQSPTRRTAMSLTFTTNTSQLNTPKASTTRNRLSQGPVLLPSSLEPVEERENPPPTVKKIPPTTARKRWSGGNSSNIGDLSNIPPPPPIPTSRFERERNLGKKTSTRALSKNENTAPTTTSAQLLRAKRSVTNISKVAGTNSSTSQKTTRQQAQPPGSTRASARPPSRTSSGRPPSSSANSSGRPTSSGSRPPSSGAGNRPGSRSSLGRPPSRTETQSSTRPKTPHGSNKINFRHPAPFLPAGGSVRTSHHIVARSSRQTFERPEDRVTVDKRPTSRVQQRSGATSRHSPSSSGASTATTKRVGSGGNLVAPEHLRREAASTMTQPTRKRYFGDGTELEAFDDLPTSTRQENRFTVTPVAKGAPRSVRPKSMSVLKEEQPKKKVDRYGRSHHQSQSDIPSYLRETAASRNAREITQQRLGMAAATPTPPSPTADRWRAQIAQRSSLTPKASKRRSQTKPHLIKPMGSINTLPKEAAATGMTYNPRTMRWDGNEKDLQAFETTESRTPARAPALITKVNTSNATPVVQVVGGMVFDPSRMCWLKVDEDPDDEVDPFDGVEDIPADDLMSTDNQSIAGLPGGNNSIIMGGTSSFGGLAGGPPRLSGGFGEFVVGEEFDVGPMFVGRQKEEEERWRKRTEGWILPEGCETGPTTSDPRYLLRELLVDPGFLQLVQQRR